jgi:hypothetical protein
MLKSLGAGAQAFHSPAALGYTVKVSRHRHGTPKFLPVVQSACNCFLKFLLWISSVQRDKVPDLEPLLLSTFFCWSREYRAQGVRGSPCTSLFSGASCRREFTLELSFYLQAECGACEGIRVDRTPYPAGRYELSCRAERYGVMSHSPAQHVAADCFPPCS